MRAGLRVLFAGLVIWLAAGSARAQETAFVDAELRRYGFPKRSLSLYVRDVTAATPWLERNVTVARNPASTMKLLVTRAALALLGPAYRWKTQFFAGAAPQAGTLNGDLYLKGFGDPFLVGERFWRLLRELRQRGLRTIDGDLVIDATHFALGEQDPAAFDGKPYRAYNALPNAVLLNYRVVQFKFFPDVNKSRVRVIADPHPVSLKLENRLTLAGGRCGYWAARVRMLIRAERDGHLVRFSGSYPQACERRSLYRVIPDNRGYIEGMFRELWAEQGGRFTGKVRGGIVPEGAGLLAESESRSLADLVRAVNKYSNNVMARQILLTLAAERFGPPGTVAGGRRAIREWLASEAIDTSSLTIANGSGLAREARVSARLVGELLVQAWRSPLMPEFVSSLPLAGVDGTLRERHTGNGITGRAHLKTGLIDDVRALAGFLHHRGGRTDVVVMLLNSPGAHGSKGERLQDALLERLLDARQEPPAGAKP